MPQHKVAHRMLSSLGTWHAANPVHKEESHLADTAVLAQPTQSGVTQVSSLPDTAANALMLIGVAPVKQAMLTSSIQTMASGGQVPQFKFFFYAQPLGEGPEGAHFLVELLANTSNKTVSLTVSRLHGSNEFV